MFQQQPLILLSLACCGAALLMLLFSRRKIAFFCLSAGFGTAFCAFFLRCFHAWPMLPMYTGLQGTTVVLMACVPGFSKGQRRGEGVLLLAVIILLSCILILFPKNFYLPLRRSITIWSYLFLFTGTAAKALLLVAAAKGVFFLVDFCADGKKNNRHTLDPALVWAGWGFALLTISMFSGEMWSYLGWGTPVVWHDPAVVTFMALWLYWVAFLHLHHTPGWSNRNQALFMVVGGVLVLFSCWSDLGPFRPVVGGLL